jgi:hypothetical protein
LRTPALFYNGCNQIEPLVTSAPSERCLRTYFANGIPFSRILPAQHNAVLTRARPEVSVTAKRRVLGVRLPPQSIFTTATPTRFQAFADRCFGEPESTKVISRGQKMRRGGAPLNPQELPAGAREIPRTQLSVAKSQILEAARRRGCSTLFHIFYNGCNQIEPLVTFVPSERCLLSPSCPAGHTNKCRRAPTTSTGHHLTTNFARVFPQVKFPTPSDSI